MGTKVIYMMWIPLTLGLLPALTGVGPMQESIRPEAKLIRTFDRGDYLHAVEEAAIGLTAFADKPQDGDTVAVRICSREPMPVALATASGRPFYLATVLANNYRYPREDIVFLRSESCPQYNPRIAITEYWAVPYNAELPSFVESVRSSQVNAEEYFPVERDSRGSRFKESLRNLATTLHTKPGTVGVIVGYYFKKPSAALKKRLREARRFMEKSRLPKERYFIRHLPWTGTIDTTDPEPEYPNVIVIEMAR
jgi:hypothetical protein